MRIFNCCIVLLILLAIGIPFLFQIPGWHWPTDSFECVPYVVQFGDTLWSIASKMYPNQHTGRMIWAISRANGLEGAKGPILHIGQILWIPDPEIYGKSK